MKSAKTINKSSLVVDYVNQQKGIKQYVKIFNNEEIKRLNLSQTIECNQSIFTSIQQLSFPQHFLQAKYYWTQSRDMIKIVQPFYDKSLEEYIKLKLCPEDEALNIFQQVLKSVFSMSLIGIQHRNLRPEHFVFHHNRWKLKSIVTIDNMEGYQGQYSWNAKYQSPEQYNSKQSLQDEDGKILVWNLGSLLLDLLIGPHLLADELIINKFKNKQFSMAAINSGKTISFTLATILGKMLHYDANKRMTLKQIYANEFLSKDIAIAYAKYKQNKETTYEEDKQNQRQLRQSHYQASIIRKSKQHQLPIPVQQLQVLNEQIKQQKLKKSQKMQQIRNSQQMQDDQYYFNKFCQKSKYVPKEEIIQIKKEVNFKKNKSFKAVFEIYKIFIDKTELLSISSSKIALLPFTNNNKEQLILLNQFAVYYVIMIQLQKLINSINREKNIFHLDQQSFVKFLTSQQFEQFKIELNQNYKLKSQIFKQIVQEIINLAQNKKKLLKSQIIIREFFQKRNFKTKKFEDFKTAYRKILLMSYELITGLFNQTKNQDYCRLCMYVVYCLTIDKLYIQNDLKNNFQPFTNWIGQDTTHQIQVMDKVFTRVHLKDFQNYIEKSPYKTLIIHSKKILLKYYNLNS